MKRKITYGVFLDYMIYLFVLLIDWCLTRLPERVAMAVGRFIGRIVWVSLPDRRSAALENLTIAFGEEKSPQWIRRTAMKSFEHVGMLAVEFFRIRRWSEAETAERIVLKGRLPFNLTMMPGGHGIVLLNSHFGCFEVSAATTKFVGLRLNLLQSGLKNPFLNRYFFSRAGKDTGIRTFRAKGVVKELTDRVGNGEMMACLADQRGDVERGVFVSYFGKSAPANEVFAKIAIEGKARVMPLHTVRGNDGKYYSEFGEEVIVKLTGDRLADLTELSQQFHNIFEQWLREYPEQGFWLQRKWRRKPSRRRARRQNPGREASRTTPREARP